MSLPPLGLYVHLPWCERKCPYCDFNSHERAVLPESAYLDALLADLAREYDGEERALSTVFIGGGTPSLFSVEAIERLMDGIRSNCVLANDAEITLEANPGSTESQRLSGYVGAGVTRFSLGIQSFSDTCLKALGRVHDRADARRAIDAVKLSGAGSFNLDLMHGLPGQTPVMGIMDLEQAIAAEAPHLSWYQLTIEPNTRFYSSPPELPVDDDLESLEESGASMLEAAGYRRYEVSAWARPGAECRHNLNYWRFGDYLAIGAGAHGKLTSAAGRVQRYAKTRQPDDYLAEGGLRRCNVRQLTEADLMGEFMMNALRLTEGFTLNLFESHTGLNARELREPLGALNDRGLLSISGEQIKATALGLRFLDDVVGFFFKHSSNEVPVREL